MIDAIRSLLMLQMCLRYDTAVPWHTELCPLAEERYGALVQEGRTWLPRKASESVYEVLSEPVAVVDLLNTSCSCRMWQISGFPCAHAACVLNKANTEGYNYVEDYFHVWSYKQSYAKAIFPFARPIADPPLAVIGPPEFKPKRGRPKTKRIASRVRA
ncbi:PREDICTED: uncharacterized protein LOC105958443 [Erythranthe guttata]|uniref:uncharacterized protein LOC105958443 n=1 Tax=Erythranthe guttata TaxID=4155 RepID=UPI00064D8396|nr:PREDICTED: uncharacterized protein LOC105958443 [Erythranthe guttata]|eukprot:XP_012837901.1 PREDICTED: uncharacterized protein LOC105958443 [Erythranthe guttata]